MSLQWPWPRPQGTVACTHLRWCADVDAWTYVAWTPVPANLHSCRIAGRCGAARSTRIRDYFRASTAGGHALQMELRYHVLEHDGDVDVACPRVDGEQVRIEAHGNLAELRSSGLLQQDDTVRVAGRGPAGRHDDPSARVDGDALGGHPASLDGTHDAVPGDVHHFDRPRRLTQAAGRQPRSAPPRVHRGDHRRTDAEGGRAVDMDDPVRRLVDLGHEITRRAGAARHAGDPDCPALQIYCDRADHVAGPEGQPDPM